MKAAICKFLLLINLLPFIALGQTPLPVSEGMFIRREQPVKCGDKELAIANYKKSLELNPKNTHGAEMLKRLTANEQ